MTKIKLDKVTKVFGARSKEAVSLLNAGKSKTDIRKQTGATVALDNVTLEIPSGAVYVVMGLSGSGKSTLLRLVNRLIEPTSGDVMIDGQSILDLNERKLLELRRTRISMVFQNFALFPHKTVLANAVYGLSVRAIENEKAENIALDWIKAVGLSGYETAYPHQLSGGMQQRVGLARALVTDPDILLMDEPFSALDPLIRREMQDQMMELQTKLQKTVLFITHDLAEAFRLGDTIAILRDGALIQQGSKDEILENPADRDVETFVKSLSN